MEDKKILFDTQTGERINELTSEQKIDEPSVINSYEGQKINETNIIEEMYNTQYIPKVEEKGKKRKRKKGKVKNFIKRSFILALASSVAGLIFGIAFAAVNIYSNGIFAHLSDSNEPVVERTTLVTTDGELVIESSVANIAENVMPSIVSITSMSMQEVMSFFGGRNVYESESAGSGIIIGKNDSELLILTNNHVVEGATTLTVSFVDDESVEAVVKGGNSGQDIAVLAIMLEDINADTMEVIKVATLGDSDQLKVGESVIAIGNALGYGQSVTTGVVSALERLVEGIDGELLQTDAAINPGNSGGALLNANGEVIGINTAKMSQSAVEGMGYAIPISDATDTIEALMNRETKTVVDQADRGYIGIRGVSVTEEASMMYNMPSGVYISEIIEGGACEAAGITKGSVITGIDGIIIDDMDDLQEELSYYKAGESLEISILTLDTNGEYVEMKIKLVLKGE